MRYSKVALETLGYQLAPMVVTTAELEAQLEPVYDELKIPMGQIESLTGITERRWWEPGFPVSLGAAQAARKALETSSISADEIEVLIYAGVCRDHFEPATACHVAAELGIQPRGGVYDISNACLGVLNGILDVANRIELGQIRAGMVVTCESAREIVDVMIGRMQQRPDIEVFRYSLATLTGGSGAAAVIVTDESLASGRPQLLGGVALAEPEHHRMCQWGLERDTTADGASPTGSSWRPYMSTDSVGVLKHGMALGQRTWDLLLKEMDWAPSQVDKVICHQVGSAHQQGMLRTLEIPESKDFSTYTHLGNMGTAALPITAALAQARGHLTPGDQVSFLGIGSGLNCMMLGLRW